MGLFGGPTPKIHKFWTNLEWLAQALSDRAGYMSRSQQEQCAGKTVKKYVDKKGVRRCVGLKAELKNSQCSSWFELKSFVGSVKLFLCMLTGIGDGCQSQPRTYTAEFGSWMAQTALTLPGKMEPWMFFGNVCGT